MLARRHALLTGQGPLARLHRRLAAAGRDDRAQGVCRVISALLGHLGCLVKNHRVICFGGNPCTVFAWQGANVGDARQIQRTCQSSSVMKPRGMAVKRSPAGTWDVPRWQRYCGWSCGDVGMQGDGTAVFQCTYCCFALTRRKSGGAVRRCCQAVLPCSSASGQGWAREPTKAEARPRFQRPKAHACARSANRVMPCLHREKYSARHLA